MSFRTGAKRRSGTCFYRPHLGTLMPLLTHILRCAIPALLLASLNSCSSSRTSPAAAPPPSPHSASTFYLDCSAAANGSGTQASPWNSPASVNAFTFIPGDHLLLNRGTTCNSALTPHGSGSSAAPIVIDAYGVGAQPIINGGSAEEALKLFNQQYWEISNLEIVGGNLYGVYISGNTPNVPINHIHLTNLNVHGATFTSAKRSDSGEVFLSNNGSGETFTDVLIDGVTAHDSHVSEGILVSAGGAWIESNRVSQPLGNHITVQNSTAHDIYGDGILVAETNNGLLQNNVVYNSGLCPNCTGSTPVGLWEWYCHTCTVQNNESYSNQSWGGDGGDFDIDYYNNDNIVQYNYGHDSAGYCVAFFGAGGQASNDNVFRYNVCSNNGQRSDLSKQGEVDLYTWDNGSLNGVQIYNNTFYWNPAGNAPALSAGSATFSGNHPVFFRNNIIYAAVPGMIQVPSAFTLDNNIYWTTSSSPATWQIGSTTYTGFAAYQAGSTQDPHSYNVDPMLNDPTYHAVGKPTSAFTLLQGSPAIGKGANVCGANAGCSMGTQDFWGNTLPNGSGYNIGAWQGSPATDASKHRIRHSNFSRRSHPPALMLLAFLQTTPDTADTPSRREVAFLHSLSHQYRWRGLKVTVVDSSGPAGPHPQHQALINAGYDWHLDIPIVEDRGHHLSSRFAVAEFPTIMLLTSQGKLVRRWQGFAGPATLAAAVELEFGKSLREHNRSK